MILPPLSDLIKSENKIDSIIKTYLNKYKEDYKNIIKETKQ